MQKKLLLASLLVNLLVGIFCTPFIARNLTVEQMAVVSVILFFNSFLGAFDVFRPIFIRSFSSSFLRGRVVSIRCEVALTLKVGLGAAASCFILQRIFLSDLLGLIEAIFVSLGLVAYFLATVFWAVLDGKGSVGAAQFSRSVLVSLLYVVYLIFSKINAEILFYAAAFFVLQACSAFLFFLIARPNISWAAVEIAWTLKEIYSTAKLNAAKIVIDFSDRLMFAKFLPAGVFSSYSISYEIGSRMNIVPQYINSYSYPRLCRVYAESRQGEVQSAFFRHHVTAALNFVGAILFCVLASPYFETFMVLYAGDKYREYANSLGPVIMSAALYSLAFYAQSYYRSLGEFSSLTIAFALSAFFGLIAMPVLFFSFGGYGILFSALILKSPGISVYVATFFRNFGKIMGLCFGCMIAFFIWFAIVLISKNYSLASVTVSFIFLASFCNLLISKSNFSRK